MTEHVPSRLSKWPFVLTDLSLLAFAAAVLYQSARPLGLWQIGFCLAAISLGGWFSALPFLREYRASVQIAEANTLSTAISQLKNIESIRDQIQQATSQWLTIQEQSASTVRAAKEITDRMKAEAEEFCAFFEKANQTEKTHLRLEVEKLKRAEGEWLQVTVRILDHIFALNRAAAKSGQPGLMAQLNHFQQACRDVARRTGLAPFAAAPQESFDAKTHQPIDAKMSVAPNARITETVATGYTFQGQLLRRAVVAIGPEPQPELPLEAPGKESISSGEPMASASNPVGEKDVAIAGS